MINPSYNIAATGVGTIYLSPTNPVHTQKRKEVAYEMGRTTTIMCHDFSTAKSPGRSRVTCAERKAPSLRGDHNQFLFEFIGVRALASCVNKVPGTIRHHLNKGTPLRCTIDNKTVAAR